MHTSYNIAWIIWDEVTNSHSLHLRMNKHEPHLMDRVKEKGAFVYAQNVQIHIILRLHKVIRADSHLNAFVRSQPGIRFPLTHSIVSNDTGSRQRRSWSNCARAQSDLGLRCPQMSRRHIFAWCASNVLAYRFLKECTCQSKISLFFFLRFLFFFFFFFFFFLCIQGKVIIYTDGRRPS